jgi:lysyl oxidase
MSRITHNEGLSPAKKLVLASIMAIALALLALVVLQAPSRVAFAAKKAPVDRTPPETNITAGPSGTSNSASATFEFSSSEPGASFECKLDAGAFASCASPKSYSNLSEGAHIFEVRATDAAGNVDATPAKRSWTVGSTTPPVDKMPDLGMLHPKGLEIRTVGSEKQLWFVSIIVNVGAGPFELHGQRAPDASTMTTVKQRIFDGAGGSRDVDTSAIMEFGGDGHSHWHVQNLEDFELQRLDNGSKVGTFEKRGFCFYDNYLYGSDQPAFYRQGTGSCGGGASATQTMMGLSVGWGDRYGKILPDQYIDITGLTAGSYRLIGTADPSGWFAESDNLNNKSWVDIRLTADDRVTITAYGPSA